MSGADGGRQRRPVWRNFAASLTSEFLGQALAFLLGIYLARTLGPNGFGTWVFATAILTYAAVVVDGGTELWGFREVSTDPGRLKQAVLRVALLRLAWLVPTIAVIAAIASCLEAERRLALILGTTSLVALVLNSAFAHRGLELLTPALGNLVQRVLMLGLALALVQGPSDAPQVTLWQGLSEIAAALLLLAMLAPRLRVNSARVERLQLESALREAWPLGASRVLRALPAACAPVVLGLSWSGAEVGNLGAAMRLAVLLLVLAAVFHTVTFPAVARACLLGGDFEARVLTVTLRLLATLLLPFAVAGAVLAQPLIRLLLSSSYDGAARPLSILLGAFLLMAFSDLVRRVLVARHQQRLDLVVVVIATAFGLACIAALTPWLGMTGAATAMMVGEVALLVLCKRALDRTGPSIALMRVVARPALVSVTMGALLIPMRHAPLWMCVGAWALMYLVFIACARAQILDDLRHLEGVRSAPNNPPASDAR